MNGTLTWVLDVIAAVAALGTAAVGLVDATKAFNGGLSNAGFSHIRQVVTRLVGHLDTPTTPGTGAFGWADTLLTLRANWMNGMAKADQKAAAKGLIRLNLTPDTAAEMAPVAGVPSPEFKAAVKKLYAGTPLGPDELGVLGRFDAIVSAMLDEAYERADQSYRNAAKLTAALIAVALAIAGGAVVHTGSTDYWSSSDLVVAILVGLVSTPLAPVAKDLATALTAATRAAGVLRR